MVRVPTPLPRSLVSAVASIFSGSVGITVWRLVLIAGVALALLALAAANLGFFAGVLITLAIWTAWSDNMRRIIGDLWNARFFSVNV